MRLQATCRLGPAFDVRPVPRRAPADSPLGLGEQAAPLPLFDGFGGNPDTFGDLFRSDGFAGHFGSVEETS